MKNTDIHDKNSLNDEVSGRSSSEEVRSFTKNTAETGYLFDAHKECAKSAQDSADSAKAPTTLEMRPPLKLLTVEEAKAHMKGDDKKSENNSPNDKNEV